MNSKIRYAHLREYSGKHIRRCCHKFYLSKIGIVAKDIYVTLSEHPEPSLLWLVSAEYRANLKCLERTRKLFLVIGIVSGKRKCQVIPESAVCHFALACIYSSRKVCASLHHLKDKLLIISALFACKIFYMFHNRSLYLCKSKSGITCLDH